MSLSVLKQRYIALMLFFIDYKVLILCFTILVTVISGSILIEKTIFNGVGFTSVGIFNSLLPSLILFLLFIVSYRVIMGVYFFRTIYIIFLLSSFLACISLYSKYEKVTSEIQKIHSFTGKNVWVTGVVTSRESSNTFLFDSGKGGLGSSLIRFAKYTDLHAGQRCKLSVKVVQPSSFSEFDYKRYLFRKGIYSILDVLEYECKNGGSKLLEIRYSLERVVERAIPEPESSLLIGIMFGSKRVFTDGFNEALRNTGVSHVIAASGYNVALVANGIDVILRRINGRFVNILKIFGILLFSIFSGFSASLIRASTMSSIYFFALFIGRYCNKFSSLLLCITLLMLFNPFLIYDIGFLFSFLSTTGLIFLPSCFEKLRRSKFVKESVLPSVISILFTVPVSILFFGKVSVISVISNILIIPIISGSIFWGLGATLLNFIFPSLKLLFLIPYVQLLIFKYFVQISSNIDMVELSINPYIFGIFIYLSIFIFCLIKYPISSSNYYISRVRYINDRKHC